MLRRALKAAAVGVPTAALAASAYYRETHRPHSRHTSCTDLSGSTVVITGATSGIGKAVAARLASRGATVVMGARDKSRGEAAKRDICSSSSAEQVIVLPLDLSDLQSVQSFAKECQRRHPDTLSAIISVAAEIVYDGAQQTTPSGADTAFATNHLGLQALVAELEPALLRASGAGHRRRVVIVGSRLETRGSVDPEVVRATGGARLNADYASRPPTRSGAMLCSQRIWPSAGRGSRWMCLPSRREWCTRACGGTSRRGTRH